MARIKLPEFKENEEITSSQFNEVNEAFKSFTVNGENLANEAINEDFVNNDAVFGSVNSTSDAGKVISCVSAKSRGDWLAANGNWLLDKDSVTVTNLATSDKALVRASCRVYIADVGAKTFFSGRTPVVKLMLAYRTNVESSTGDDSGWTFLPETCQEFRLAFSTKIPSDSSLSWQTGNDSGQLYTVGGSTKRLEDLMVPINRGLPENRSDFPYEVLHRDTTDPSEKGSSRYSLSYRYHNSLDSDFSYTTAYLFNNGTGLTYDNVQFALWGSFWGFDAGGGDLGAGSPGNVKGCLKPQFDSFTLYDFNLYAHQIKR